MLRPYTFYFLLSRSSSRLTLHLDTNNLASDNELNLVADIYVISDLSDACMLLRYQIQFFWLSNHPNTSYITDEISILSKDVIALYPTLQNYCLLTLNKSVEEQRTRSHDPAIVFSNSWLNDKENIIQDLVQFLHEARNLNHNSIYYQWLRDYVLHNSSSILSEEAICRFNHFSLSKLATSTSLSKPYATASLAKKKVEQFLKKGKKKNMMALSINSSAKAFISAATKEKNLDQAIVDQLTSAFSEEQLSLLKSLIKMSNVTVRKELLASTIQAANINPNKRKHL